MFENKTQLSLDLQVEFNIVHLKKARIILYTVLGLLWLVAGLLFFLQNTTTHIIVGIAIWASFIIVIALLHIRRRADARIRLKKFFLKNPACDQNVIVNFVFNENDFNYTGFRFEEKISYVNIKYEYLLKVIESKENLYLYTGPNQACILDGNCMTKGSFEDLKNFLKSKLDSKYKKKNKKANTQTTVSN